MSVIEFHIWPEDNPVGIGNRLAVITDEDVVIGEGGPAIWYEPSLHGLGGSAGFSISRHSPLATSTIIREGNLVRVKVPEISSGYLKFGWWMKSGEFHLIDSDEAGGENITIEGPGLLHKLATGSLYHSSTVSDQPARGSADREGLWWWTDEPYGAILTRAAEEGRHAPYPDPAEAGSPLEFFDITFSRTHDSNAVAWPNIDAEFQVDIGTDLMTVADRLRESGNLYIIGDASDVDALTVHCYQTYGEDLTGAFAADTVRFEKNINIATELVRRSEDGLRIDHLLLRDSDGNYSTEVWPGYVAGDPEHWGFWDANQTNDDSLLNAIGANVLAASQTTVEALGFEALPGKDPSNGLYLPDLHYKVGDFPTLHTGTDPEDYDEATQLIVACKVSVREGSTDDTSVRAQRSLKIEPQLNYYSPRYGSSNTGTGPMQGPGCRCLELCQPGTVAEPTVLFRYTSVSDVMTANPAIDAGWGGGATGIPNELFATPGDTRDGTISTTQRGLRVMARFSIELDADTAPMIAAGGATILMHARARTRAGIGISESAQHMISEMCAFVTAGDSTTKRGTALALSGLTDSTGSEEWNKSSTLRNMEWPAAAANNVLSPVGATVPGDFLVIEAGVNNFVLSPTATGAHIHFNDQPDAAGDLPSDLTTTANLRSWIQLTVPGTGSPNDGHPDLVGTDKRVPRCGHRHDVHRDRAPTVEDDESLGYKVGTIWAQLDDLSTPTDVAGVWILANATAGAAVWLSIIPLPAAGLLIEEEDGTPSAEFATLRFPDASLTDNGDGSVSVAFPGGSSSLTVEEEDGTPSESPVDTIQVPNGTLTVDSAGVVSLDYATSGHTHGGGGGAGLVDDLFNSAKGSADTPDDEFPGTSLDAKWTVADGTSGTIALLGGSGGIYQVGLVSSYLHMLIGTASGDSVLLRQDYTLPDGNCIVAPIFVGPDNAGASGGISSNEFQVGIGINSTDTGPLDGTAATTAVVFFDSDGSLASRTIGFDGTTVLGSTGSVTGSQRHGFLRVDRVGLVYHLFVSWNVVGYPAWEYLGSKTLGSAANNIWLFGICAGTAAFRINVAVSWFRQGTALAIKPW